MRLRRGFGSGSRSGLVAAARSSWSPPWCAHPTSGSGGTFLAQRFGQLAHHVRRPPLRPPSSRGAHDAAADDHAVGQLAPPRTACSARRDAEADRHRQRRWRPCTRATVVARARAAARRARRCPGQRHRVDEAARVAPISATRSGVVVGATSGTSASPSASQAARTSPASSCGRSGTIRPGRAGGRRRAARTPPRPPPAPRSRRPSAPPAPRAATRSHTRSTPCGVAPRRERRGRRRRGSPARRRAGRRTGCPARSGRRPAVGRGQPRRRATPRAIG